MAEGQRRAKNAKRGEKEAQLRAWQFEHSSHVQRDAELAAIGNESPEVEDREGLYAELLLPRPFAAEPFVASRATAEQQSVVMARHAEQQKTLLRGANDFPKLSMGQLGLAVAVLVAGGLMMLQAAPTAVPIAGATAMGALVLSEMQRKRLWAAQRLEVSTRTDAAIAADLEHLERRIADESRATHDARATLAAATYEHDEQKRLAHLRELQAGDVGPMQRELAEMFPLELPVDCRVTPRVMDATSVALALKVPGIDALQQEESRLLVSGKVSYKAKTQKKLKDEYQRLVAGLALRHASEAMLLLPSVSMVKVSCGVEVIDPSTGTPKTVELLAVDYDFAKLAPLQMAEIDPVEALTHFHHVASFDALRKMKS